MLGIWQQGASIRRKALRIPAKVERRLCSAALQALATNRADCKLERRAQRHRDCRLLAAALGQWLVHTGSMRLWNAAVSHFNGRCACSLWNVVHEPA